MKQLCRVVWSEGMYLGPHDFQAQSAWFESSVDFAIQVLSFKPYGYVAYSVNEEAIANGTFSLVHARGIFPDGLPFLMDECDPLPISRSLPDLFAPTANHLLMYLAVPEYRRGERNTALSHDESNGLRYAAEERVFVDEITGSDEKRVAIGRKNIQIVAETERTEGMTLLPLARVRRNHEGRFVLDEQFIPPCVRISASKRLLGLTEALIETLIDKSESVRPGATAPRSFSAGMSPDQIASYWFRHALDSAIPILRHLCFSQRGHPEELFRELSRLAGALCTFGLESDASELPLYNHEDLETCFNILERHIREHLEMLAPSNCVVIPLKATSDYFYAGQIKDARCLGRSRWLLAIRSRTDEAELISEAPKLVKVCSMRFVGELVRRAVPGMRLLHVAVPPAAATPRVDTQYFSLTTQGPCWEDLVETKQVGVYVPGEIQAAELELLVLLEGNR